MRTAFCRLLLAGAALASAALAPAAHAGVPAPLLMAVCDSVGVGVPDPSRSSFGLSAPVVGCQYRFRADGGFETLTVHVTLRDAFDAPIPNANAEVHLVPQTPDFCSCDGTVFVAAVDPLGVADLGFARIGGRGQLALEVTAEVICPQGSFRVAVGSTTVTFTSPDLNGSCESPVSTNVLDLGVFAAGLSFYVQYADYDCDLDIDIVDLAIWAHGLGRGCG